MKRLLSLLALFPVLGFAQTSTYKADTTRSLLWEISGKGLKDTSYLFGTIHVICPDDYFLPEHVKNAFAKTKQVAFEIDLDDPSVMMGMLGKMKMSDDKKLSDLLSKKDYAFLSRFFSDSLKLDIEAYATMKPLMIASTIAEKSQGCSVKSYELELMMMAMKQGKSVMGLEKLEDQLNVIEKIPYKKQAEMLLKTAKEYSESKKNLREIVAFYRQQDVHKLQELFSEEDADMKEYEPLLLGNRNKNWIPVIEKAANEKATFFAVGAGHLGGEKGVIELLRKEGFTLRAITK